MRIALLRGYMNYTNVSRSRDSAMDSRCPGDRGALPWFARFL